MKFFTLLILSLLSSPAYSTSWKKVTGGILMICPKDYIFVFNDATYTTRDFCVMKYEAKNEIGMPVSTPNNLPWVNINRATARLKCQSLGLGYDLISNDQWQTIARNIAGVGSNWSTGSVASGELNRGHSDKSPASLQIADGVDNNSCASTGQSCSSSLWNSQRRTHELSNKFKIWDFSGNAREWVTNDSTASNGASEYMSQMNDLTIRQTRYGALGGTICSSPATPPYCGMGYGDFLTVGGAIVRGGYWDEDDKSGIFATTPVLPTVSDGNTGFRCIFVP